MQAQSGCHDGILRGFHVAVRGIVEERDVLDALRIEGLEVSNEADRDMKLAMGLMSRSYATMTEGLTTKNAKYNRSRGREVKALA